MAKPDLGSEEAQAAGEAVLSGWVTQGPKVQEFESAFREYVGTQHACAVSSCTAALHLSLLAVGVKPGNVVLTVSHSFIATANSIRYCNAEPVFIDIDPVHFNMDPKDLGRCLTDDCISQDGGLYFKDTEKLAVGESPLTYVKHSSEYGRVAAVLVVHQMGTPCDLKNILPLARKYNLPVVEDAACAVGSEISMDGGKQWERIGKPHGDIACFSFHPRKVLTTGDGGMITTNNSEMDRTVRLLRHQAMSVSDLQRHKQDSVIFEEYPVVGYNYRMTDIQASVGTAQLKKLTAMIERRRDLAEYYRGKFADLPWIRTADDTEYGRSNWQSFPIYVSESSPVSRDGLMQYLLDNGVSTRRGIMNSHQEPPYANNVRDLHASENARDRSILLPFFTSLAKEDIDHIVELIKNA